MPISDYLGFSPRLAERIFVHESSQIIGDVCLADDVSLWCNTVLRGDVNHIVIGRCSNIQDFAMCHVSHKTSSKPLGSPLIVGDYVTVGHSAVLHGCEIGNDCLIGLGTIVMDDARISSRVMIGAGSLVPPGKHLESGYLYVGRPVEKVRQLSESEVAYLRYSAEHYVRLKNNYLAGRTAGGDGAKGGLTSG